jgi:hypothetical protein
VLVEKHGQPRWQPASLAGVDEEEVKAAFASQPGGEDLRVGKDSPLLEAGLAPASNEEGPRNP